jgi:uncharacterized oxidoreductase
MDFATSTVAEGKIRVARAKGETLPPGYIVNAQGEPSTDPADLYGDLPGALLPFGGHKGFALAMFADIFAGALTGAGCSKKGAGLVANAMLAVFLDPRAFSGEPFFLQEVGGLVKHVKDCPPAQGFDEILMPGEPEQRAYASRSQTGIPLDEATWSAILRLAEERGVPIPRS